MSYPKQLLRLRPLGGQIRDVPASEIQNNFLTLAENVQLRQGLPGRIPGSRQAYNPPSVAPLGLVNVILGGINYWIYVGQSTQYVVETATHSNVTLLAGLQTQANPNLHSLPVLNNVVCHSNALDPPMYWPGAPASRFLALPGWPAGSICRRLIAHRYHLFALNMDESGGQFPMKLLWSAEAQPGTIPATWTPAASNEAGDVELADTPGEIVTGATLRDTLLIYKRASVFQADYVGGNLIYAFRPLFRGIGALCERAVAATERGHVVVTDGDVVLIDGLNVQTLAYGRIRKTLFSQIDQDNADRVFAVYHRTKREVWIAFPESGASHCSRAMVYHLDSDGWTERVLAETSAAAVGVISDTAPVQDWDSDAGQWDLDVSLWNQQNFSREELLLSAIPGTPEFIANDSGDSQAVAAVVSRQDLAFDQPERIKFVRRAHVRAERNGTLYFRVGARMTLGDAIAWGGEVALAPTDQVVNVTAMGRYISWQLRSSDANEWQLGGVDLEVEIRGYH